MIDAAQKFLIRLIVFLAVIVPGTTSADSCQNCHQNPDFYVQDRKLYSYYQGWLDSPHANAGLSCADCHGGDATADDMDAAHRTVLKMTDPNSKLFYKNQPSTCGKCHSDKVSQFKQSKHYKALIGDSVAPTCATCHGAMNRRPYYRAILATACQTCHNEQNVDKLPLVKEQAEEVLHRLNIVAAYLGWVTSYYEKQHWPGKSRDEVAAVTSQYKEAVTRVHSFDLEQMDESSANVLKRSKLMFQQAWSKKNQPD